MKLKIKIILLILSLTIIPNVYSINCDQNLGCLLKKKFYGYVSGANTNGQANIDDKNVLVFRDKIVFYKENSMTDEINKSNAEIIIPFEQLNLECGKFQTRVCHAKDLVNIKKTNEYKKIKENILNAGDKCIGFTFTNNINRSTKNLAVLCVNEANHIKDIITFKNFLSQAVTKHLLLVSDKRVEKLSRLIANLRDSVDCGSKEYQVLKALISDAGKSSISTDCKIIMQYSPEVFLTKKDYCLKHFIDEIEKMLKLVSLANENFWNSLKSCVYNKFGFDFSDNYIISNIII